MELFLSALASVCTPYSIMLMVVGVAVGIIFGCMPGLSAAMAVALFLPISFTLEPVAAMTLLVSLYIGAVSGGLIAAILLNIPGTPSSIATCFDGVPMAQNGDAAKALGTGIVFSFLGGMLSFIALIFLAPTLADLALKFTPAEYFGVTVFALTMIAALSTGSMIKGMLSGMVGMIVSTIGLSPIDGAKRFTMGIENLTSGFDLLAFLIGMFAITEILIAAEGFASENKAEPMELKKFKGFGFSLAEFYGQKWNLLRSSIMGMLIGILPGIGGSTSGILSYVAAKNQSKYPEKFGTGIMDGIVASETANNATIGGALVPLLALGIPGDGVTAMLLGGFMIHGLTPGPLLFITDADFVFGIFAALLVANVVMLILEFFGIRIFIRLLKVPKYYLLPVIAVLCVVGSFAVSSRVFDVITILIFGLIGYAMYKGKIPLAPSILGFILGPLVETNLRRGMQLTEGSFWAFFQRPIAATFMVCAIIAIIVPIYKNLKAHKSLS